LNKTEQILTSEKMAGGLGHPSRCDCYAELPAQVVADQIIRVFPRKTKATPQDSHVYFDSPTLFSEADEVHVSVTFTYDLPKAEKLAEQWGVVAPVRMGGPAIGERSGEFVPGMYLKPGYVITSRGCPNACWFCSVWRREGREVRELEVKDGWNLLDDNILACSESHIRNVFSMLKRQSEPIEFTGGLEAARLEGWHVDLLLDLKLKQMFFAYDTPDDLEPLRRVAKMLIDAGIIRKTSHCARCYVLVGHPKDDFESAEKRLKTVAQLGMMPMAMLWKNGMGESTREWRNFQREWASPTIVSTKMRGLAISV